MTPETGYVGYCVHKSNAGVYTNIVSDAFTTLAGSADPNQPIYDLFAGSVEGAWYDFSDPEMMIANGISTSTSHKHVPALNGAVSVILDRRLDLVADGTKIVAPYTGAFTGTGSPGFASFTDNGGGSFTASKTTAGGVAYAQGTAMAPIDLVVGEVYRVTFTVTGYGGVGDGYCFLGSGVNNRSTVSRYINANGTYTTYLYAHTAQTNATLVFGTNAASWAATISNVSVAKVLGNHARMGATTATLRQDGGGRHYVEFDSTDRFYTPVNINLGANNNLLICQPHLRSQNAASARLFQHGATVQINGHSPDFSTGDEYKFMDGTASLEAQSSTTPETVVWTATRVKSGTASLRINGVEAESAAAGSGTLENAPLYIGSTSVPDTYFAGGMYGLLIYSAAFDSGDIALVEEFMADKCGVSI